MEGTLIGRFTALKSAISEVFLVTGDAGLAGALRGLIDVGTDVAKILGGVEGGLADSGTAAKALVAYMTALAARSAINAVIALSGAVGGLAKKLGAAALSGTALNAALFPVIGIVAFGVLQLNAMSKAAANTAKGYADLKAASDAYAQSPGAGNSSFVDRNDPQSIANRLAALDARENELRVLEQIALDAEKRNMGVDPSAAYQAGLNELPTYTRTTPGVSFPGEKYKDPDVVETFMHPGVVQGGVNAAIGMVADERKALKNILGGLEAATVEEETDKILESLKTLQDASEETFASNRAANVLAQLQSQSDALEFEAENAYLTAEAYEVLSAKQQVATQIAIAHKDATFDQAIELDKFKDKINEQIDAVEGLKQSRDTVEAFRQSFADMGAAVITGAESFSEAIEKMAKRILAAITEIYLRRSLLGLFSLGGQENPLGNGAPSGDMGYGDYQFTARGATFDSGGRRFARGGVVNRPTSFAYAGGMGLMGEAGAEAVIPLSRDAKGNLGVKSAGGGSRTVNVQMTVIAKDADSFRKSRVQIQDDLRRATTRLQA